MVVLKNAILASMFVSQIVCQTSANAAEYDYIIVGGGTAGLVVAARFSEDPETTVAVIEAGTYYDISDPLFQRIPGFDSVGSDSSPDSINLAIDWGFITTPQDGAGGREIHYPRGKCLGGSGPDTGSLQQWAEAVGDKSWTFDNMLLFFKKSGNFTRPGPTRFANATASYIQSAFDVKGGPLQISYPNYANPFSTYLPGALAEIGINQTDDFNSGSLLGTQWTSNTIDSSTGLRSSSQTSFLEASQSRPNLKLFYLTLVKKVLFEKRGNSTNIATGIVLDSGVSLRAKKEVILSAGAFQSPQLLMVSGIGPATTLKENGISVIADRPGVGQNLTDHVFFGPSYRAVVPTLATFLADRATLLDALGSFLGITGNSPAQGVLSNPILDYLGWEKAPRDLITNQTAHTLSKLPASWPEIEYLSLPAFFGNASGVDTPSGNIVSLLAALVAPQSRGSVTIASADAADLPVINPNWLTHPADANVAVAAYKRVRAAMKSHSMSGALTQPLDEVYPGEKVVQTDAEILASVRENMMTVYHAAVTCRMGKREDPTAVVDTHARVIGVEGLRVVDASSFALLPPGHPQSMICGYLIHAVLISLKEPAYIVVFTDAMAEKISYEILHGN
ncbi:hypothetical protein F4678DRAFT_484247 [Xylaria arbuscula]|nr:hypothetical protein F4678DRAFT_484247 [Xylaria arbuscula]